MRLVAWNANFNNRSRRSWSETMDLLSVFYPDIIVLSESPHPSLLSERVFSLRADRPSLVVIANGAYRLEPSVQNAGAPAASGLFRVRGPTEFTLLAVWPVQGNGGLPYSRLLTQMLDRFGSEMAGVPTIVAGDFNSNTRVKAQSRSHPSFVRAMRRTGLESAYHHHASVEHGDEPNATFVRGESRQQRFHIDYCFVSADMLPASTVTIPQSPYWLKRSDHLPLILDIPDMAIHGCTP